MDLIGTLINVGSPSARERIAADLDAHRLDLTLRKEILWEQPLPPKVELFVMLLRPLHVFFRAALAIQV